MAIEIEHKFLLANNRWRSGIIRSTPYKQGYLSSNSNVSIRIRISNTEAWVNLKKAAIGNQRDEYEYPIPLPDAEEIINNLCQQPL
ncbi:MAG: CYTH domain-containing protein, partial [Methylococcales bacterium]